MKPVVVFVLAFVVSVAGGAGAKVMMAKPTVKSAVDSAKSDSTKTDSSAADSSAHAPQSPPTDTAIVASGSEPTAAANDSAHPALPIAPAAPIALPTARRLSSAAVALADSAKLKSDAAAAPKPAPLKLPIVPDTAERRVAKVFTSMDAKQAAKVLEHMSDGDVQIILGYVGVKQAAAIMAALPPERVATLSKLAMKGSGK
jgi:hypothetical protein